MSRFLISNLREGPDDLRRQLPISGETVDIRVGPDGQTYFSARLDEQLKHRIAASADTAARPAENLESDESGLFQWVSNIVIRASNPATAPHHGMQRFPVDLAYVVDPSYHDDETVDFTKLVPIAAVDIDDLPEDGLAEPAGENRPHQDPQPSPSDDPDRSPSEEPQDLPDITSETATSPPAVPEPAAPAGAPGTGPSQGEPETAAPELANDPEADQHVQTLLVTSVDEPPPAAATFEEDTEPARAAETARPPVPSADSLADTARGLQQRSGTPPAQGRSVHTTYQYPAAPPPPSQRSGSLPPYPWPESQGANSPSHPAQPHTPQHGMQPYPVISTAPNRRTPSVKALTAAVAILVGMILIVVAIGTVVRSGSGGDQGASAEATQDTPPEADIRRLKGMLPQGYSESSCVADDSSAHVSLNCGPNAAPGGPQTATYTLFADQQALEKAFAETIATYEQVNCPGNIQSPGPWRRNASLDTVAGTLFCGTREGRGTVVWTSDAQSLLNVAEGGDRGPSLGQLYDWWARHS